MERVVHSYGRPLLCGGHMVRLGGLGGRYKSSRGQGLLLMRNHSKEDGKTNTFKRNPLAVTDSRALGGRPDTAR